MEKADGASTVFNAELEFLPPPDWRFVVGFKAITPK
jgi:hypothetical protein